MTYSPGHVGVIAKSGTLSYETVASLTRAGVGQSLCIGMGGDVIAGTDEPVPLCCCPVEWHSTRRREYRNRDRGKIGYQDELTDGN